MFKKVSGGALKRPMYVRASVKAQPKIYRKPASSRSPIDNEKKYFDTQVTATSAGALTLLNVIPTGTTQVTRIGKKVLMKSLNVQGLVVVTAGTYERFDIVLFYDKRPTGAAAVIGDLLTAPSGSQTQPNDNNAERFVILKRYTHSVQNVGNGAAATATDKSSYAINWMLKLNKKAIYKSLGTGAIADQEMGSLYIGIVDSTLGGGGTFTANCRVRFSE